LTIVIARLCWNKYKHQNLLIYFMRNLADRMDRLHNRQNF
jgi:hypothetical protein